MSLEGSDGRGQKPKVKSQKPTANAAEIEPNKIRNRLRVEVKVKVGI